MAWGHPASWSVWAGLGVVGLKVAISAAQLPGQAAAVAITWLVTIMFVTLGVLLVHTDVPAANGWGCILVALSTVPGDLNDPHYARASCPPSGSSSRRRISSRPARSCCATRELDWHRASGRYSSRCSAPPCSREPAPR